MSYPREIAGEDVSEPLAALIFRLAWHLVDGPDARHALLRRQLAVAQISSITLTRAGLFARFQVPATAPRIDVSRRAGGQVTIHAQQLDLPAGSLLSIADGRLACVEIYTFGNRPWPEEPIVSALSDIMPIPLSDQPPSEC